MCCELLLCCCLSPRCLGELLLYEGPQCGVGPILRAEAVHGRLVVELDRDQQRHHAVEPAAAAAAALALALLALALAGLAPVVVAAVAAGCGCPLRLSVLGKSGVWEGWGRPPVV